MHLVTSVVVQLFFGSIADRLFPSTTTIQRRLFLGKLTQRATAEVLELKANALPGYNATNHTGNQGPSPNMLEDQRVERKGRVEGKWDVGRVEREGRGRNLTVPKNKYSFFKLEPLGY